MNEQQFIKRRARKYFWQQKFQEIWPWIIGILGIIFVPYYLGVFFEHHDFLNIILPYTSEELDCFGYYMFGLLYILILIMLLCILGVIIYFIFYSLVNIIKEWIEDNEWEANYRANQDWRKLKYETRKDKSKHRKVV